MEKSDQVVEQPDFKGLEVFESATEDSANVELLPSTGYDIMPFAKTPEEMASAQSALIQWVRRRLEKAEADCRNAEKNLYEAREAKIRTAGWRNEVKKYVKEVNFYTKVSDALSAGYFMVPDFPIDIIGVRTTQTTPSDRRSHGARGVTDLEEHEELPIGEGEYVDPRPPQRSFKEDKVSTNSKETYQIIKWTGDGTTLKKMDFPFRFVRPQLLRDLKKAVDLKVFDEIGVLPARRRRPDPMLVGAVEMRLSKYQSKKINFLIGWWISTTDL